MSNLVNYILEIKKELPTILIGDKFRLNRVIQNLLSNSNKFTKDGIIKISVNILEEKDKNIKLLFEVKDNGKGIEKEKLSEVFKPYYQAHEFDGTGSGLGLSLSKEIVELMGGDIKIESELNKGTKVTFTINLQKK